MAEEAKKSFEDFLKGVPDADAEPAEAEHRAPKTRGVVSKATPKVESGSTPTLTKDDESAPPVGSTKPSTPTADSGASPQSADEKLAQVLAALKKGDINTIADLVEEDPALYDEKTPKWAAGKRKAAKLQEERDGVLAKAEGIVTRTAPIFDGAAAVRGGDFARLPDLVESLIEGYTWDELVLKVARARHASDPAVPVLRGALAKKDEEIKELRAERTTGAERALVADIKAETAENDVVRKIPDWEKLVMAELKKEMDPHLEEPNISIAQAVRRVVKAEREEFDRRAAIFGDPPKPPRRRNTLERASGPAGAPVAKMSREQWLEAHKNG